VDLRERVVGAVGAGMPQTVAARTFGVGRATVRRWLDRRERTGGLAPSPRPGAAPAIGPAEAPALRAQVAAAPDATLAEHCDAWAAAHGVRVGVSAMHRALRRLVITRKKRRSGPASRTP
jgi:putative transposase